MKKLIIDEQTCVCCGCCVANCEAVLGWADDGTPCVEHPELIEENKEDVEKAIEGCPTGAIKFEEK